jgi:hypothetical protein
VGTTSVVLAVVFRSHAGKVCKGLKVGRASHFGGVNACIDVDQGKMAPRFKISATVFTFSSLLAVSTMGALAYTQLYGPTEEEKEKMIVSGTPEVVYML